MTREEIIALAERCEKATGEKRETLTIFEDAFALCFPKPSRIWVADNNGPWTPEYSRHHERGWAFSEMLEANAFLDAAMTLVPEGWGYSICPTSALLTRSTSDHGVMARAATPALALTAAALRARATLQQDQG
jgi:hypothetical protein